MSDTANIPDPQPFWFVPSELLMSVLSAEIGVASRLLADHSELPHWFDNPETATEQRKICFAIAARTKLGSNISDTIADRYEPSCVVSDEDWKTFQRISNFITSDAPDWVEEMNRVVDRMPARLWNALPEPLRAERNSFQEQALQSAMSTLDTIEKLQMFVEGVFDQQWKRLARRWPTAAGRTQKPKYWLKGTQGLTGKGDLSRYMQGLTEKQQLAASLKWEYGLGLSEIASRMGINRKTAAEHMEAAKRKIDQAASNEKAKAGRATRTPEL